MRDGRIFTTRKFVDFNVQMLNWSGLVVEWRIAVNAYKNCKE